MNRKCIIHLPFYIDVEHPSGSQIRPIKMINAFKNIGYDVEVISGYGDKRKSIIKEIKENIKNGIKYEFVYSESSTEPTLLTEKNHLPQYPILDFNFLKYCKEKGIKIGLFYRDIYWKFPIYSESVGLLKRIVAKSFYKYDLKQYNKIVDVLYLPCMEMSKYISEIQNVKIKELPPAIDEVCDGDEYSRKNIKDKLRIFYVGGISGLYDLKNLFIAINKCNNVELTVCCRKSEWEKCKDRYEEHLIGNIKIIHKSGDELKKYYLESDIASLFFQPSEYRSFAMPLKLFEYIQYNKPIITTKGTATGNFVERYGIGWNINYDVKDLVDLINYLNENNDEISIKSKNMSKIIEDNKWNSRAKQVEKDLS